MKKLILALAGASMALSSTVAYAETQKEKGEARLAKMLEGREAGEPRNCISTPIQDRLQIINQTAVVYDAGKTIYVARPDRPEDLDDRDIFVFKRFGSQLCRQDVIRTVDRSSGFPTGFVFLSDFVPYTKKD
ncbi:hypothetical protein D6851_04930 [Altericroceibacterium spongiae]|uniref:Uncharacterized protein n=1 Tax=Altericroceibacterium spongiae TaxID=2320269 RepID=A0A420EPF9_9SPHN|nr:hypothetical protein [Altericroceibacterium spongiae]RKF22565.1 hypothetical protein D6851_04930 [Altericroceibacterium spongiae]